ncbi:MAG: hydantoinase/oxoprolinase family protein [Chloroflexi bacterium]|nr:hydantoinase/oxoprolinase family protein [Chloroflexota bacterium]
MTEQYRIGVDIGGTFTDGILLNEITGEIRTGKVPSTPDDPSEGFLRVVNRMLDDGAIAPEMVKYVVHGTTVATNAIIEGNLAKTAFITTEGFRDLLEIQTGIRPTLYDLQFEKLRPLVPRYLSFGVPERLDFRGDVLIPLDEGAMRRIVEELRGEGVESIAVCLLHSYINSEHEERIGEILGEELPTVLYSLSSAVAPEFREYFRASTTVINAAIRPVVSQYLGKIKSRFQGSGISGEWLVMQSSGGVFTFEAAMERPVFMVESGPAAGVIAANHLGKNLGHENVISFDMGGTTAKAGLIENGTPRVTKDYEVGGTAATTEHGSRGSGYPIRTPVIDLVEIGAGGGSIAWIDSGGILRVGPRSAGADPGPVCYGQGGTQPTITDANLVLGRISPDYFLGGEMRLDVDAARQAIKERCADPLGMGVDEVALGIVEIANSAMVGALRRVSVQRGYDPRDFVLVAFGGAGPVHANRLAAELEMPTVLVPMSPGTTSAMGLLVTDIKHDYSVALIQRADRIDINVANEQFQQMRGEGQMALSREGVADEETRFVKQADMRYVGQSYELTVSLREEELDSDALDEILAQFHQEHERSYGFKAEREPVEFVALRLSAMGVIPKPQMRKIRRGVDASSNAVKETRPVYFAETGGRVDCPIFDRYELGSRDEVEGPAIIEEVDSTTVIHPGYRADVDEFGNLFLSKS